MTLEQAIARHFRHTAPDFLTPRGTVAVNVPRGDIASVRARLSLPNQVAQRPNLGVQVCTRGRLRGLLRLPHSPWDVTLSTGGCCLVVSLFRSLFSRFTTTDGFNLFPSVAELDPLFAAYRTTCSATSLMGLNGVCIYSPQLPAPRDNGPYRRYSILSYLMNGHGGQPTLLCALASLPKALEGLVLCQKPTDKDLKFFRLSEEVLAEEKWIK